MGVSPHYVPDRKLWLAVLLLLLSGCGAGPTGPASQGGPARTSSKPTLTLDRITLNSSLTLLWIDYDEEGKTWQFMFKSSETGQRAADDMLSDLKRKLPKFRWRRNTSQYYWHTGLGRLGGSSIGISVVLGQEVKVDLRRDDIPFAVDPLGRPFMIVNLVED